MHDPLTRAAIRNGSDKYGGHLYTPVYHRLFSHWREAELKLLEIGVGGYDVEFAGGLSLKTWMDYFPYAEVTGLDLYRKTIPLPRRAKIYQGSQTDDAVLAQLCQERGPFDIVIDDGSHDPAHMIASFLYLYPRMAADGIYVIEDTQTCFGGDGSGANTIFDLAHQISLAMHTLEGYRSTGAHPAVELLAVVTHSVSIYRNMVVFHRGENSYPSNQRLDFSHAEVRRVFAAIGEEAERDPAPGDALSRIDMLIWAGKREAAAKLALQAATRYPGERALLHDLVRMMKWAQDEHAQTTIAAQLAALDP